MQVRAFDGPTLGVLLGTLGVSAAIAGFVAPGISDFVGRKPTMIVLPLFVPPVIFGGGALDAFTSGLPWGSGFALLGAYAAMAVAIGPVAMAAACRNALS